VQCGFRFGWGRCLHAEGGQGGVQLGLGALQVRIDGAQRQAGAGGDLAVRQLAEIGKAQHPALGRGQSLQRRVQPAAGLGQPQALGWVVIGARLGRGFDLAPNAGVAGLVAQQVQRAGIGEGGVVEALEGRAVAARGIGRWAVGGGRRAGTGIGRGAAGRRQSSRAAGAVAANMGVLPGLRSPPAFGCVCRRRRRVFVQPPCSRARSASMRFRLASKSR